MTPLGKSLLAPSQVRGTPLFQFCAPTEQNLIEICPSLWGPFLCSHSQARFMGRQAWWDGVCCGGIWPCASGWGPPLRPPQLLLTKIEGKTKQNKTLPSKGCIPSMLR